MNKTQKQLDEERKLHIEHQEILKDLRTVLAMPQGKSFIKYLFKSFNVGEVPSLGMEGNFLHDHLGFLRAGNSIFKIVSEANAEVAGMLLAQIEKEKYAQISFENQQG